MGEFLVYVLLGAVIALVGYLMRDRACKAEAENAKLRELATDTIRLMQADGPDCGLCKHFDECWADEAMNYSPSGCVICNEARELGVEVDG